MNDFGTGIWDIILSVLVIFHVTIEFVHYIHEYLNAKKEKNILKSIQENLQISKKIEIQIPLYKPLKRDYGKFGNTIQDRIFEEWDAYYKQSLLDAKIEENKIVHDNMAGCTKVFSNFIHKKLAQLQKQRKCES